ncbi:MAG: S8 family serine peptidase, partial [Acidobacteriota bacterium]
MKPAPVRPLHLLSFLAVTFSCLMLTGSLTSGGENGDRRFDTGEGPRLLLVDPPPAPTPLGEPTWTPDPKLGGPPIDGERLSVLVWLDSTAPLHSAKREDVKRFATEGGGFVRYEYRTVLPDVVNVRNVPRSLLEELRRMPGVVNVTEDEYHPEVVKLDESTPQVRGLQSQLTAAGLDVDGTGVRVCVADTGIDMDHAMYSSRIDAAASYDFANDDGNPDDDNGHGAHVAGIAVGGTGLTVDFGCDGTEPFQGVAPGATLIGAKILNAAGGGSDSDIIAGIDHCADQSPTGGRADVINLSIGTGNFTSGACTHPWAIASNNAVAAGVVVVAASGNENNTNSMGSPACGADVIAVGAVYKDDYPNCEDGTSNFNWGVCVDNSPGRDQVVCFSNESDFLDVTAPGSVIQSASNAAGGSSITGQSGTSQASPMVAGLAALILDADPTLTPAEVRQIIRDGAVDLGPAGFDRAYGHGRIDVIDSLSLITPCSVDGDCDDGLFCNGAETCDAGDCVSGAPPCADLCDEATDSCLNLIQEWDMSTDPGWTTQGQWAHGVPTGGGGQHGGPDPTGGATGSNVLGYDLNGDYANNLVETHVTSTAIDCSGLTSVTVRFQRWLGVEQPLYDHAYFRVSNDGSNWTTLWENAAEVADTSWSLQEFDISGVADGQSTVYLRWTMGTTDGSWQFCGWNLDDVQLHAAGGGGGPSCSDGIQNQGEDRIDCGGPCPACECTSDAACDDGDACNGVETCDGFGTCQAGTPPACDDGLFCNGTETCDSVLGCQAGTPPNCDDGVSCTTDSCNEATDSCDNVPVDSACDDGLFCNGVETCDPVLGCVSGSDPCPGQSCNETSDTCLQCLVDADCDDGLFCNGDETCSGGTCQSGSDPCPGQGCDEAIDQCIAGATAQMETGTVVVGGSAVTVDLVHDYVDPVVVCSVQYASNATPTVTRMSNVVSGSFDVRLVNPSGGAVAAETVSYLVVEAGAWTIDGVAIEAQTVTSTVTDDNNSWVGEAQSYLQSYTNPVVLGQVMSSNDPAWSVFWCQGASRTDPPSASTIRTGKTVCEDTTVPRADETIGFIVIETGHGSIGGVEYEAALGADTVLGVTNAPPYTYTFSSAFASVPEVAVVTMAAMDGNNGGWAQTHGASPLTATTLGLSIDEDQIGDTERAHTSEQVGYAVFATAFAYPAAGCVDDAECDDGLWCNGDETCNNAGSCDPGTPPACDDGIACTIDSCNEASDSCDNGPDDSLCDDGIFCNGIETCDPAIGCQPGTPPSCDDGVGCTIDSCDGGNDACSNAPDDSACDDGLFCNGTETCDPVLGCQSGSDPCAGQGCDEVTDECLSGPVARLESVVATVGGTATTISLTNTYDDPVVACSVNYANNTTPIVARVSNVGSGSFDLRLQSAAGASVSAELVSCLVVEAGTWTIDGVNIEAQTYLSTVTDDNNSWLGQSQGYGQSYADPVVLGQVMSENDPSWSVFWCQGTSRTNPPSASALVTGKTVCEDPDATRADETVGFIVIEAGSGTIGGVTYEAALGADSVRGVGNGGPYPYTFSQTFASA